MKKIIFTIFIFSGLYAQCEEYNQFQCSNNDNCNWVEHFTYGNCGSLTVSQCYDFPGQCYVDSNPGWYDNSGSYCTGGTYQIDDSHCEEAQIPMPECSEMQQTDCSIENGCEWIADIDYFSCDNFNQAQCNQYESCSWTLQYGGSYGQWFYGCGGLYEVDNSFCQDFIPQIPECSEYYSESGCNHDETCEWIPDLNAVDCQSYNESSCDGVDGCSWDEDIQYGYCYNLSEASCDANPECYYDCEFWHGSCAGCCYGSCLGGSYIISDNSTCIGEANAGYCTESFMLGDVNSDNSINVIDVVELVTIILASEYIISADMNNDGVNNIADIILLVSVVLGN